MTTADRILIEAEAAAAEAKARHRLRAQGEPVEAEIARVTDELRAATAAAQAAPRCARCGAGCDFAPGAREACAGEVEHGADGVHACEVHRR